MTQAAMMSQATDRPHTFRSGGACVWCGVSPEKVADRKAPPFCEEREFERDDRAGVDPGTGY